MARRRGEKISRSILLLLDRTVEPVGMDTLPAKVSKFSRHLFSEEKKYSQPQVGRALIHLVKSGHVDVTTDEKNHDHVQLTEKGRKHASAYRIDMLVVRNPKHWDGKWRMIVFDIPEAKRKGRDAIRHKLKQLNFFKLQESVWIYPYDCRRAVTHLAEYYDIKRYIHFATVDSFDQEEEVRKYYGIHETALPYEAGHKKLTLDFRP